MADLVIAGAGPAGIAAAVRAATCGRQVTLLDDNLAEGGQIWRGGKRHPASPQAAAWFERLLASGAKILCGSRIIGGDAENRVLLVETARDAFHISYEQLILATGARELFLPFPGWTLPNVTGVGGLQALVKAGLPVKGKRVVVGGSGPLLLAVASYLRKQGATIAEIVEQADWMQLARFGIGLAAHPGKLLQAAGLRASLGMTPFRTGSWITEAGGLEKVRSVRIQHPSGSRTVDCDYLAVSYGLAPNTELASLLGCRLQGGFAGVDGYQRTSRGEIFSAGEATGIGGVDLSLVEGEIAGYAASGREDLARSLFPGKRRARAFAENLNRAFALREELRGLPQAETLVCRCEDVSFGKLREADSWRSAKLHFRCGMGPCQGRICGPAAQFLFGWKPESVRPPLFPGRVGSLVSESTWEETTSR